MRALAAFAIAVGACAPHPVRVTTAPPREGVSIALYESDGKGYGVVDDRRWIDLAGSQILLANIDPGASLASLVIETTGDVAIGPCVRDRIAGDEDDDARALALARARQQDARDALERYAREQEVLRRERELSRRPPVPPPPPPAAPEQLTGAPRYAPIVRCQARGTPGRHLVRIVYVSTELRYRAAHEVSVVEPARARVSSRFAIVTPPWRVRADVVLFEGMPGGDKPLREIARGQVALDGSTVVLARREQAVGAGLRRVYDGAILATEDTRDVSWGHDSVQSVFVWLELAKLHLAPGPIDVHLELPGEDVRDVRVAETARAQADEPDAPLRLALWADESLRGSRQRIVDYSDGNVMTERLIFAVSNTGDEPREVFVDEHLRPAAKRRVERAWPKKPAASGSVLRTKLVAKPGTIARTGYVISYEF